MSFKEKRGYTKNRQASLENLRRLDGKNLTSSDTNYISWHLYSYCFLFRYLKPHNN